MTDQQTKDRAIALLWHHSPRIGSTGFITSPLVGRLSIELRYPVATDRCVNDGPVFS
jgi:hypothetical protein